MKKNIIKSTLVVTFALLAGYNVYSSQESDALSDLALANIEALAGDESNPNTSYGYGLKDCKSDGRIVGAKCELTHPYDECNNKSTWGNCN